MPWSTRSARSRQRTNSRYQRRGKIRTRHSGTRVFAWTSDVQLHIGESRDSGFALRAPRNDGGKSLSINRLRIEQLVRIDERQPCPALTRVNPAIKARAP